jgi:hypothetical protein
MQMYIPNSEISIPIYKPRYTVGDVIYIPNKNNKGGIYLKIISSFTCFSGFSVINGSVQTPNIVYSAYTGQIMLGSNYDNKSIPVGKALVGYSAMDALDVDARAKFVGHKKGDYCLYDEGTPMAIINTIEENLEKQAIETNFL